MTLSEYPDLARRSRVTGVPKTVVNDRNQVLGALPEDGFIAQALQGFIPEVAPEVRSEG